MPNKPPNCECFNTGFQHCVLYPKEFCKCSASCTFVNDYLQGGKDDDDAEIISMRTFSGLISPIPDADLEEVSRYFFQTCVSQIEEAFKKNLFGEIVRYYLQMWEKPPTIPACMIID